MKEVNEEQKEKIQISWVRFVWKWMGRMFVVVVCVVLVLFVMAWSEFGDIPQGSHLEQISSSPNYDVQRDRFVNRRQAEYDNMQSNFDMRKLFRAQIWGKEVRSPTGALPQEKPDIDMFLAQTDLSYYWLGHSTVLLRLDGKTLLLDPVFTNAAPLPFLVTRFQKPVLEMEELPPIDLILISHDHYDHLDKQSIAFFRDKETQFIVPLGVSSYLKGWGIDESRITELDWWQEISFSSLKVACTPSQHFSGRRGPRGNKTLWASWAVIGENERFYFSGDSGFDTHFAEIGEKYGPFDVAFMESGQYNPMWHMTHMFPEESVDGGIALKAKSIQPIHWGMFRLSTHDWFEPPEEVRRFGTEKNIMINTPILGEIVQPSTPQVFRAWWRDVDSTTQ